MDQLAEATTEIGTGSLNIRQKLPHHLPRHNNQARKPRISSKPVSGYAGHWERDWFWKLPHG